MILSLETATSVCSVALHEEGKLRAHVFNSKEQTASSELAVMVQEALRQAGVQARQLQAVAVSAGPGSYTGLRIGVATAKGLCFSLGIPMISLNTLLVLSIPVMSEKKTNALFCPMIDARRMEVYCMLLDGYHNIIKPMQALVVEEKSFHDQLALDRVVFFGNGASKCRQVISNTNAIFLDYIAPDAQYMGDLAQGKFLRHEFEDVFEFEPFYLKDFVAKKPKSLI